MRPAPTRVETYCSRVLLKVPRWRRSKASTAGSCVTPERDWEITDWEMPLAAASREMLATKELKWPPHWGEGEGVERRRKKRRTVIRAIMIGLLSSFRMMPAAPPLQANHCSAKSKNNSASANHSSNMSTPEEGRRYPSR